MRLPRDNNFQTIQAVRTFQTQDAAATPNNSPFNYTDAVTTLTVPGDAMFLYVRPTTLLRVSEQAAMTRYFLVDPGIETSIPVVDTASVFITRDAANGSVTFRFDMT
ncbi:MAG: hypothetical protein QME66_05465 [Candidatus Eisenbacteria bacterium]|nr:hypothetical protein [Candidatus Eisenbacteria bacterium]